MVMIPEEEAHLEVANKQGGAQGRGEGSKLPKGPQNRFEISIVWEDGQIAMQAPTDPLIFMTVMGDAISGYAFQNAKMQAGEQPQTNIKSETKRIVGPNAAVPITKSFFDKVQKARREGKV